MNRCNTLRIDQGDGSGIVEYRIGHGSVETRTRQQDSPASQIRWQAVTPEQLSHHIIANTTMAYWLRRRMGIRALVRACREAASRMRAINPNTVPLLLRDLASLQQDNGAPRTVRQKGQQHSYRKSMK